MPQSLSNILIHLIWSTKDRHPWLTPGIREKAHAFLAGAVRQMDCEAYRVGGVADHVHLAVSTLDVDIFVSFRTEPGTLLITPRPIYDYLTARGCAAEGEYLIIAGWPVQFLPPTGPLAEEALAKAAVHDVAGVPARVFTAEHLAARPIAEKLRMLDALRERALLIRPESSVKVREEPTPYRTGKSRP
jgi:hypothetical protein